MRLVSLPLLLLFVLACEDDRPASVPDDAGSSLIDSGPDGSVADAAVADAAVDAASVDGSAPDAAADASTIADASGADARSPEGFDCALRSIALDETVVDSTVGGTDVRDPAGDDCLAAFASGPERVYVFTAPVGGTYRVTVTPTNDGFDPMLYVQDSCADSSTCRAAAGLNGPGGTDSDTFEMAAGDRVVVTVDTDFRALGDTEGGPFELRVSAD